MTCRLHRLFVFAFLLGSSGPCAMSQTSPVAPEAQTAPAKGVIAGTVLDSEGDPVVGAAVVALRLQKGQEEASAEEVATVTTDDQGAFRLFALMPGSYQIRVAPTERSNGAAASVFPANPGQELRNAFELSSGRAIDGLALTLPPAVLPTQRVEQPSQDGVEVAGTVRNWTNDTPLSNVRVALCQSNCLIFHTRTDAGGHFVLHHVPPGQYRPQLNKQGFLSSMRDGEASQHVEHSVHVTPDAAAKEVSLRMVPQVVITGRIFDEGHPVTGAIISLMRMTVNNGEKTLRQVKHVYSDDRGDYRLFGLLPGTYYLSASYFPKQGNDSGDPDEPVVHKADLVRTFYPGAGDFGDALSVTLRAGETSSAVDIALARTNKWSLSGKLAAAGQARYDDSASVTLLPQETALLSIDGRRNAEINRATGEFHFDNLVPGRYVLSAQMRIGKTPYGAAMPVTVAAGDLNGVVMNLEPALRVTGVIDGGRATCKTASVRVWIQSRGLSGAKQTVQAITDDEGRFILEDIRPDLFHVELRGVDEHCYLKSVSLGASDVDTENIPLGRSEGMLLFHLRGNAAQIEGEVQDSSHQPVRSATVAIVQQSGSGAGSLLRRTVLTDEAGTFAFRGLVPGTYRVFTTNDGAIPADTEVSDPAGQEGAVLQVEEGSDLHVQLTSNSPDAQ